MNGYKIREPLQLDLNLAQTKLKNEIFKHQACFKKLKNDPYNFDLQKELQKLEEDIILAGLYQKKLLDKVRQELVTYQQTTKINELKNNVEKKDIAANVIIPRNRKQNIVIRTTSANSFSDESGENLSDGNLEPDQDSQPLPLDRSSQSEFLGYFGLVTHEVFKEMQNKRVERKRRSTANPQFLYGNKGWDLMSQTKRKRNAFLLSPPSPPHTRQSVRKKQEQNVPLLSQQNSSGDNNVPKEVLSSFPSIPNLPSGLIIERVSPGDSASPDAKTCVACKQTGRLNVCDVCFNGFHISCHNRPLTHTPHQCPKCISKEIRTVGSLNVPSGMSVSYITSDISEKLNEKKLLEEKRQSLKAELLELQNRHSQLTISLNDQRTEQEELVMTQQSTECKIKQILTFIESIQNVQNISKSSVES